MRHILLIVTAACLISRPATARVGTGLIPNGDLLRLDEAGWPVGWPAGRNARVERDGGGPLLVCSGGGAGVPFRIALKPEYGRLKLSMRMRVAGVVRGRESWQTGRLTLSFHQADGTRVGPWPNVFGMIGTTDWVLCEREYPVPPGSAYLLLSPCNLGTAGTVSFRALSLTVSRLRAMRKEDAQLPPGADPEPWDLADAWRQTTPTRERVCLNGLWGFRPVPATESADAVPPAGDCWGWFKIPGMWPEDGWAAENGVQRVWLAPWLEEHADLRTADRAWYRRRITVPADWAGRRVTLVFTLLQTHARVFVDGHPCGELWYPGGELDLSDHLKPGAARDLALLVAARPLTAEHDAFMAPDRTITEKALVKRRGVTGDLYLQSAPAGARLEDVHVITSVRDKTVTFAAETSGLGTGPWRLRAAVVPCGGPPTPRLFESAALTPDAAGALRFTAAWPDARTWDTDTPRNRYDASLTLDDAAGRVVDTLTPVPFGFREIRIAGRDFLLNGTPLHLRALHNVTANGLADKATVSAARELCSRMAEYGFNAIIGGNYDFAPGSVGYLDGLLQACDETGMLMAFSLPHIKDFGRRMDRPEVAERYRKLTAWLIRRARNHPSVILYAMNHNSTGYYGDQNPLKIDGIYEIPPVPKSGNPWWERNREQARIAGGIARALDPTRPVYHHQSGHLDDMHTVNCYLNWAPVQERSEWAEHWSVRGVKPLFFVEWGLPHISSWSSYRGPQFIWRCEALQSLWAAEYAAQFRGDAAYRDDDAEVRALDHEEEMWAAGKPFRWSDLNPPLRDLPDNYHAVQAHYADDNWRSHRAWGVSAMLPWDQGDFWQRVATAPDDELAPDPFKALKQPGIVPDRIQPGDQYIRDTGAPGAFVPTAMGRSLLRWNRPDCAFIGGRADAFTEKSHLFAPGAPVSKTLIVLNDRRRAQTVRWTWRVGRKAGPCREGTGEVAVSAGGQARVPVSFVFPEDAADGEPVRLTAGFEFEGGATQADELTLHAVTPAPPPAPASPARLYDPRGLTAALFDRLRVPYARFDGAHAPGMDAVVVIGREALDGTALPWLSDISQGRRVLVFEQRACVLEGLLGFRIAERGTRRLFTRYAHPATRGLDDVCFRDWGGEATLLPPHLTGLPEAETHDPRWQWCGFTNTRVWRCGNRGSVASVLIEKPAKGDWRALLDGGFDLQYAALLETVVGRGRVIFCQADVTGRRGEEPLADRLVLNLLAYVDRARPERTRRIVCAGGREVTDLLAAAGATATPLSGAAADLGGTDTLLVAGPGAVAPAGLADQVASGLNVLCLGMSGETLRAWCPVPVSTNRATAAFARIEQVPPECAGLSNADWAWHGRMTLDALVTPPEERASASPALRVFRHGTGRVVVWQVPPWCIDERAKPYLRTSKRRAYAMAARLLANLGGALSGPLGERFAVPTDKAWLKSYYLDVPEAGDDPYRYYRW